MSESVLLLSAFTFYFGLAFVLPTARVLRQTGKNPYVLPMSDDAFGFVSRCMKVLIGGLFAYFIVQLLWPTLDDHMGVFRIHDLHCLKSIGWMMLVIAIVWTAVAQYQMGRSWRIGIDTREKTELVTNGLFAWSRNPIFLAMRVCLAALMLIQPNAVTLVFFLVGDVVMQFQVRLEEAFLVQQHGKRYSDYRTTVRRWL